VCCMMFMLLNRVVVWGIIFYGDRGCCKKEGVWGVVSR